MNVLLASTYKSCSLQPGSVCIIEGTEACHCRSAPRAERLTRPRHRRRISSLYSMTRVT